MDLDKRNRLIAKYAPPRTTGAEENENVDDAEGIDIPWSLNDLATNWPEGIEFNVGPLFQDPQRFARLSSREAARILLENASGVDAALTVSIEDFFDGNTDAASIATNLYGTPSHPGLAVIRDTLMAIRARPEVTDVRIEILEWPNPLNPRDNDMWPAAEAVHIWTTAPLEQVEQWVDPLRPDGIGIEDHEGVVEPPGSMPSPAVHRYRIGWD
jgi:hypothetical protein